MKKTTLENNEKIENWDFPDVFPDIVETIREMERDLEEIMSDPVKAQEFLRPKEPVWTLSVEEWKKLPDWLSLK